MLKYPHLLSAKQTELLCDLIEWWTEDYEEATSDVERDHTHESPESMLVAIDGMHNQFTELQRIRAILKGPISGRNNQSVA